MLLVTHAGIFNENKILHWYLFQKFYKPIYLNHVQTMEAASYVQLSSVSVARLHQVSFPLRLVSPWVKFKTKHSSEASLSLEKV